MAQPNWTDGLNLLGNQSTPSGEYIDTVTPMNPNDPILLGLDPINVPGVAFSSPAKTSQDPFSVAAGQALASGPSHIVPMPYAAVPVQDQENNRSEMPRIPGPTYVPGQWSNGVVKPEHEKAYLASVDAEKSAADEVAKAKGGQSIALAGQHMLAADQAQERLNADVAAHEAQKKQEDDYRAKTQRFIDDAASEKVDPDRYMNSQGTVSRIAMILGSGLGGWSTKGQGPNQMLSMIQKNIDRDIQAQEKDLDTKHRGASNMMNMLGEMRASGLSDSQARATLNAAQWKIAGEKFNAIEASSQDPIYQANASQVKAGLDQKQAEAQMQLDKLRWIPAHTVGGATGILPSESDAKVDLKRVVTAPNGDKILVRSEKEAERLTAASSLIPQLKRNFAEAQAIREDPSWVVSPEKRQRLHTLQALSEPIISKLGDDSVLRESEQKEMRDSVTTFTSVIPGTSDNLMKTSASFDSRLNDMFTKQDAPVVKTGYAQTPYGNTAPYGVYAGRNQSPKGSGMPSGAKKR